MMSRKRALDIKSGCMSPVFDIDMAKCCYCNLCTYPCPTECIYMTPSFEDCGAGSLWSALSLLADDSGTGRGTRGKVPSV